MIIYKTYVTKHGHPLSNKKGRLRKSRYVLYKKLKGYAGVCNWCKTELTWDTLCADHLDSNIMNDVAENIVGSCRGCNANREDGTGHGRRKPIHCENCKKKFLPIRKITRYCSIECASKKRPKRGTLTLHGTRSRYVYGCRCKMCKEVNSTYWREKYGKTVDK